MTTIDLARSVRTRDGWDDTSVLVTPLPSVDRTHLHHTLRDLHVAVSNLQAGNSGGVYQWLVAYLAWTNEASRMLRNQLRPQDIDRLVLTRRYELLLSMVGKSYPDMAHPAVNGLLSTELADRTSAIEQTLATVSRHIERWSRPGAFIVLDTSVYLEHPQKFEDLDIAGLVEARGDDLHILVPLVVVDELDGQKNRGETQRRWRASHALAVLERVLPDPAHPGTLRCADASALSTGGIPRGEIRLELLLDSPDHVRLPINDDEIIDQALAAQVLAGRPITLITYDTNQAFRARSVGLNVKRLRMPVESEPEPVGRRSRQRQSDADDGASK